MTLASSPQRVPTASSIGSTGPPSSLASSSRATSSGTGATSSSSSSSKDSLRDLSAKRMATLVYLKAVMSGRQRHASTVLLTHRDLSTVFEAERMRKRSYRHLVLGLALSPLFDLHSLQDFSKAVLAALTDVESLPETAGSSTSPPAGVSSNASMMMGLGGEKRGVRNLFANKLKSQKRTGTFSDLYPPEHLSMGSAASNSPSSSLGGPFSEGSSFLGSTTPFTLDFFQTFFSLCDILIEVYAKISIFLGAAVVSRESQPDGSVTQQISLLAPSVVNPAAATGSTTTAAAFLHPDGSEFGPSSPSSAAVNGPLSSQLIDTILRLDGKVKKILSQVLKELDAVARHTLKEELAALEASLTSADAQSSFPQRSGSAGAAAASSNENARNVGTGLKAPSPLGTANTFTGFSGPPTGFEQ